VLRLCFTVHDEYRQTARGQRSWHNYGRCLFRRILIRRAFALRRERRLVKLRYEFRELALEEDVPGALGVPLSPQAESAVFGGAHEAQEVCIRGCMCLCTPAPHCTFHLKGI